MAISFQFYADPGLTQPLTSLAVTRPTSGGEPPADRVIYLGSTNSEGAYIQSSGDPGVAPITLWVSEIAPGSVLPTHVSLALSAAGLDSATPGAELALPAIINSGVSNAIPVHVRVETPALTAGDYTEVRLVTDDVFEAGV